MKASCAARELWKDVQRMERRGEETWPAAHGLCWRERHGSFVKEDFRVFSK